MKHLSILILSATGAFAQMPAVHQVYIMPMAGGLDQYLAEWLTRDHVVQVVADPKIADAVLTDRLGEAFESKLSQIHPAEPPAETSKDKNNDQSSGTGSGGTHNTFRSSMARGTLFLVDTKTRQVLWSDYEKPARTSDANMNREAERVVKKLQEKPAAK